MALLAIGAFLVVAAQLPTAGWNGRAANGTAARGDVEEPAKGSKAPASPYAHLQDQIVPRDMRTLHEGGTVGIYSVGAVQDTAAFCDQSHWGRTSLVKQVAPGQVYVDRNSWQKTPAGTRAQVANWASKCTQQGQRVEIVGEGTGEILATYHPREGLSQGD